MTRHTTTPGRVPAAATGLLVGGAAGFLLTEAVAVLVGLAPGEPLDVGGGGPPRAVLVAAVLLCALAGAVTGLRRAERPGPHPEGGR
ncbi:hypothetical protein [Streptomyces fungicidicus]|uniref:Uncharacterized protein n=1 Tax=Streptomyces fungicidicus TaxID=68203 RepID=A0ACC7Y757_9ACTN|nr:hypothetical protein [Streptomyces fungicidicus]NUV77564.1 hypothetical protein [Streptomyces fungicidicus]